MAQPHEVVLNTMIFLCFFPQKKSLFINPLTKPNRPQRRMMQNFISIELYGGCLLTLNPNFLKGYHFL